MKYLTIGLILLLNGCAQLMHGQTQPVLVKDAKQGTLFTNCGGAVEDWGTCNDKARNACEKGYSVISQISNSTGTSRELVFKCK